MLSRSVMFDSATPWTVARQAPLSMGFSRQEYWSGLLSPPPEDLPDSGIELTSLNFPALAGIYPLPISWKSFWGKGKFCQQMASGLNCNSSLDLQPASPPCRFRAYQASIIMWANSLFLGIPVCLVSLEKLHLIEHSLQYGHGYIRMHVYSFIVAKKLKAHWKNNCLKYSLPTWAGSEWWMAACHMLLVAQLYPTLCKPMDSSLPGFSVHGILQVRLLKWVAIPFSRGSSWAKDQTWVSCTVADSLQSEPPGKIAVVFELISLSISQRGMLLQGLYPWWQGQAPVWCFA